MGKLGQISSPVINKSGISSHWSTSGDTNQNIGSFFSKDYYIRALSRLLVKYNIRMYKYLSSEPKGRWYHSISSLDRLYFEYYITPGSNNFNMHKLDEDSLSTYDNYALAELTLAEVKLFKTLPTYLGKASLLKHGDRLILLNKFAAIKRG